MTNKEEKKARNYSMLLMKPLKVPNRCVCSLQHTMPIDTYLITTILPRYACGYCRQVSGDKKEYAKWGQFIATWKYVL